MARDYVGTKLTKLTKKEAAKQEAARKFSVKRQANPVIIFEDYFHISNSGATIRLVDRGCGPTLQIESGAFGNIHTKQEVHLGRSALALLAEHFAEADRFKFSNDYCNAAEHHDSENFGSDDCTDEDEGEGADVVKKKKAGRAAGR